MSEEHGEDGTQGAAASEGPSARTAARRRSKVLAAGAGVLAGVVVAGAVAAITTAGGQRDAGAAGSGSASARCGSGSLTLAVSGTGSVTTSPNLLTVDVDVSTTGPTVASALNANNIASSAVVKAFTANGVAAKDVQTANLSIQPIPPNTGPVPVDATPNSTSTGKAITGYSVDDTVVARIRDLTNAGAAVAAAVTAGGDATRVDSLSFSLTNPARPQDRARAIAVHEAVGHAKTLASASGEQLAKICKLEDQTNGAPTPVPFGGPYHVPSAASGASAAPVPIEPGTETVTAHVSIVYALVKRAPAKV